MSGNPARTRFVVAAHRLFAEQGYAGTSVADIQQALGLTAGSGALYKHFPSKRALLEEVVTAYVDTITQDGADFAEQVPTDVAPALNHIADIVWTSMKRDRDIIRILLRDLDVHPDLLDTLWMRIRTGVYDVFAGWLGEQQRRGTVTVEDVDATSAVLLASLTYYPILTTLIDRTPGDIEAERFKRAWVASALTTLGARRSETADPEQITT